MDIISSKVRLVKIFSIMELASWIESTMKKSLAIPESVCRSAIDEINNDPAFAGFRRNKHTKDSFPTIGILLVRLYTMAIVDNCLKYPGTTKTDMESFLSEWNYEYRESMTLQRSATANEIQNTRIQMSYMQKTVETVALFRKRIEELTNDYDTPNSKSLAAKYSFDDKMNRLLVEFKYDLRLFVGNDPWIIHRVQFRGQDIVVEKMEDYRILEWTKLHENNALDAARQKYLKDHEAS